MAKFADLSNELVIAIASHIRKPADILHLCIAECRSHDIKLTLLYAKITLHHLDYSTPWSLELNIRSLCQLFEQQEQNDKTGRGQSRDFWGKMPVSVYQYTQQQETSCSERAAASWLPPLREKP